MNTVHINVSRSSLTPAYATSGSAGADLRAAETFVLEPGEVAMVPTGVRVAIPEGYVGLVFPRSGMAAKRRLSLANNVGVIDSDYRGEIICAIENRGKEAALINEGERIAQILFMPVRQAHFLPTSSLDETGRGEGGFGSTGAS